MKNSGKIRCALTMAGSDSGGGAGIQADMLAFASNGVFATSAVAAITAQNPDGVRAIQAVSPEVFAAQIDAVFDFFKPDAVKTGMLFNAELISVAASALRGRGVPAVVDPVMVSTSGARLLCDDAVYVLTRELFPNAFLITPNLDEARELLGREISDMQAAAEDLSRIFGVSVLLKGGHLAGGKITDVLKVRGAGVRVWESSRVENVDTHGSGCTLSAAIAAFLARGFALEDAVDCARKYLLAGMRNPVKSGGSNFINHFPEK